MELSEESHGLRWTYFTPPAVWPRVEFRPGADVVVPVPVVDVALLGGAVETGSVVGVAFFIMSVSISISPSRLLLLRGTVKTSPPFISA